MLNNLSPYFVAYSWIHSFSTFSSVFLSLLGALTMRFIFGILFAIFIHLVHFVSNMSFESYVEFFAS